MVHLFLVRLRVNLFGFKVIFTLKKKYTINWTQIMHYIYLFLFLYLIVLSVNYLHIQLIYSWELDLKILNINMFEQSSVLRERKYFKFKLWDTRISYAYFSDNFILYIVRQSSRLNFKLWEPESCLKVLNYWKYMFTIIVVIFLHLEII